MMLLFAAIFFLIPINLFDGVIVHDVNGTEYLEKTKLSLSYFIGIGADEQLLKEIHVKDFYLTGMGYFFVFLLLVGLPTLIGYRVWIANEAEKRGVRRNRKKK